MRERPGKYPSWRAWFGESPGVRKLRKHRDLPAGSPVLWGDLPEVNEPVPQALTPWPWPLRALGALPLGLLQWLGAGVGLLVYWGAPAYRRKIRDNLRTAGLDTPDMRRAAAMQAGRALAELPFIWMRSRDELLARVNCDTVKVLDDAEASGSGVVVLTPHLGSFEVAVHFFAARGTATVLFKIPTKAWLRPLVRRSRTMPGLDAMPATLGGVRAMLRALRAGRSVGLLPDQVPTSGDGRWAPFFGRPAYTTTLPQRLAEKTGAAVVLVVCERLERGRGWRLHFEPMDAAPDPERLNACIEEVIRRMPAQYLWGYSRYRAPAGVAGPRDESPGDEGA